MRTLRVLHVLTQLDLGGAQTSTLDLLRSLDRHRFDPTLAAGRAGLLWPDAAAIPHLRLVTLPSLQRAIHPWRDTASILRLARFMRRERFDIVHTHNSKAGILGRWAAHLARVPIIVHTIHGFAFHDEQGAGARWLYTSLERRTASITHRLVSASTHDVDAGLRERIGHHAQYALIRYGIDRQRFTVNGQPRHALRRQLGLPADAPIVGMIGCLKPQKAPLDFLRVCSLVALQRPDARFLLIGDGALRPQVERWRRRLGLEERCLLLGWRRDIPALLHLMDVFVLTSRWEGLPIAMLEAMASGRPVVVSRVGGASDVMTDGENGYLVPPGDVRLFAHRVVSLLQHRALADRIGTAAAQRINDDFETTRMVGQLASLYEALAAEQRLG